jgi:hypothetical protein
MRQTCIDGGPRDGEDSPNDACRTIDRYDEYVHLYSRLSYMYSWIPGLMGDAVAKQNA